MPLLVPTSRLNARNLSNAKRKQLDNLHVPVFITDGQFVKRWRTRKPIIPIEEWMRNNPHHIVDNGQIA